MVTWETSKPSEVIKWRCIYCTAHGEEIRDRWGEDMSKENGRLVSPVLWNTRAFMFRTNCPRYSLMDTWRRKIALHPYPYSTPISHHERTVQNCPRPKTVEDQQGLSVCSFVCLRLPKNIILIPIIPQQYSLSSLFFPMENKWQWLQRRHIIRILSRTHQHSAKKLIESKRDCLKGMSYKPVESFLSWQKKLTRSGPTWIRSHPYR